ncbi:MAG: TetR/AcrR family transcriptional regulator [Planctomycetota bacterium]|jgi:AcrR family transcriptional regulator
MNVDMEEKKAKLVNRRQEEILTAAKRIFAQNGFGRTKIDQIAEELNIGKGTIYRYFENKKSLFLAVFEHGMAQLQEKFRSHVHPITDPQEKVAKAVRTYFEFFDNDNDLIEILMQVRSEFKADYRRSFISMYSDYIVRIQENLRNGIKMGIFRELDVEKTAEVISAALQGVLQSFYVRKLGPEIKTSNPEKLTDRINAVTALLLEGLLKTNSE